MENLAWRAEEGTRHFICWMSDESLFLSQVTHSEILDFADQLKKEGRSINQINRSLQSFPWSISFA